MNGFKNITLAVLGHVEWMHFIGVEKMPARGLINHSNRYMETVAGGGVVSGLQMKRLTKSEVHFFTSLGNDQTGKECYEILLSLGLKVHVAWREKATRQGFSFVDNNGDRSITVIGERLSPKLDDNLPWDILNDIDGVFITAGDSKAIKHCRKAKVVCATPRIKACNLNQSNIKIDALISSKLDPYEQNELSKINLVTRFKILTEGKLGGEVIPGERYKPINATNKEIDSYGCGDSFAAGVTTGLAAKLDMTEAIRIGAECGAKCATFFGPYI